MKNAVVLSQGSAVTQAATAVEIRAQVNRIQEVMRAVMKKDTHYGVIPGTSKPTLFKAGSEVLLSTFRIAVDPQIEDLSTHDEIRYRVTARGVQQNTGVIIGAGIGECSSNEEKYCWRKAVCLEEFDETPADRRRMKWARGNGNTVYSIPQVRTVPSDLANTVLKMAKKRAQIDLTLTGLAASDCFTQDIEDLSEELRENAIEHDGQAQKGKPVTQPPTAAAGTQQQTGIATEKQVKLIRGKADDAGISAEQLCKQFNLESLTKLPFDQVNAVLAYIKDPERAAIQAEAEG